MATKTETLTIKVSPEEKMAIQLLALEKDVTVSKLLHRMIFPKEVATSDNTTELENDNN